MERPTAIIREYLALKMLLDEIETKVHDARVVTRELGVEVVNEEETLLDTTVRFTNDGLLQHATYMKAMLKAEVRGYIRRVPNPRRYLEATKS